jgi:hypothetical protein
LEIHFAPKEEVKLTLFDDEGQKMGRVITVKAGDVGVVEVKKEVINFHVRNGGPKPKRQKTFERPT